MLKQTNKKVFDMEEPDLNDVELQKQARPLVAKCLLSLKISLGDIALDNLPTEVNIDDAYNEYINYCMSKGLDSNLTIRHLSCYLGENDTMKGMTTPMISKESAKQLQMKLIEISQVAIFSIINILKAEDQSKAKGLN